MKPIKELKEANKIMNETIDKENAEKWKKHPRQCNLEMLIYIGAMTGCSILVTIFSVYAHTIGELSLLHCVLAIIAASVILLIPIWAIGYRKKIIGMISKSDVA